MRASEPADFGILLPIIPPSRFQGASYLGRSPHPESGFRKAVC